MLRPRVTLAGWGARSRRPLGDRAPIGHAPSRVLGAGPRGVCRHPGLRAARAGALEVAGGGGVGGGAPRLGRGCSRGWSLAILSPSLRVLSGSGGAGPRGRSSPGDRDPFSHSAHSSLSSSCNFSSALRFNLSQPDPAAALAAAGGGPSPRSPPAALCRRPSPSGRRGRAWSQGGCAFSTKARSLHCPFWSNFHLLLD